MDAAVLVPADTANTTAAGEQQQQQDEPNTTPDKCCSLVREVEQMKRRLRLIGESARRKGKDEYYFQGVPRELRRRHRHQGSNGDDADGAKEEEEEGEVVCDSEGARELQRRREHFSCESERMRRFLEQRQLHLEHDAKHRSEERASFRRSYRARLYEIEVHLAKHPELLPHSKRRQQIASFSSDVDATIDALARRGINIAASAKQHRRELLKTARSRGLGAFHTQESLPLTGNDSFVACRRRGGGRRGGGWRDSAGDSREYPSNIAVELAESFAGPRVCVEVRRDIASRMHMRQAERKPERKAGSPSSRLGGGDSLTRTVSSTLDTTTLLAAESPVGQACSSKRGHGGGTNAGNLFLSCLIDKTLQRARHSSGGCASPGHERVLKYWFEEDDEVAAQQNSSSRHRGITRPTLCTLSKRAASCLTFFDDAGIIDGREKSVGGGADVRERTSARILTEEEFAAMRRRAMQAEREATRRRCRDAQQHSNHHHKGDENHFTQHSRRSGGPSGGGGDDSYASAARTRQGVSVYRGPQHTMARADASVPVPDDHRTAQLLDVVFVRGGNVGSYLRQMKLQASQGAVRADVRRSAADRLGGASKSRGAIGLDGR